MGFFQALVDDFVAFYLNDREIGLLPPFVQFDLLFEEMILDRQDVLLEPLDIERLYLFAARATLESRFLGVDFMDSMGKLVHGLEYYEV